MSGPRSFPKSVLALCTLLAAGCSMTKVSANLAGDMATQSMPHMRGMWDYEIAGQADAAGIFQLESMHSLSPDNEQLALTLCASYVGYAFGWVEVTAQKAQDANDDERAAHERYRAELMYTRARDLALRAMRNRDDGIDDALKGKPAQLAAYLNDHYDDKDDVGPVFWLAASWGAMLGASEDVSLAIDLPVITTLVQHAAKLDESYEGAGSLVFLGGFNSQYPAQFGGSTEKGKQYFERALKVTGRRAHQVQLNYARLYAVTVQDRALFLSLLNEIIEAKDQGNDLRLANKIARVRAELLLSKVDLLF
jgi:hypothetical protein